MMPDDALLVIEGKERRAAEPWIAAFAARLPRLRVVGLGDEVEPASVRYVAAWNHPRGHLARWPRLEAIFSLGAGVDHLLSDPLVPAAFPWRASSTPISRHG